MRRQIFALFCLVVLSAGAGCTTVPVPQDAAPQRVRSMTDAEARTAAQQFVSVVNTVEPMAERECRARTRGLDCDFRIVVDDRPGRPPNAFQTLDESGRPILAFTLPLIADVRNPDELAFIMSHEAAHHIEGHIARQQRTALAVGLGTAIVASVLGGDTGIVNQAGDTGARIGSRIYSKDFELEADSLGTIIAKRAGYDPVRGAAYFTRIPDPGNRFLGTHPPNAQRIETVRRVAAGL